jgi:ADP-ribosyl-[dinitrogen reductase] hydrolase
LQILGPALWFWSTYIFSKGFCPFEKQTERLKRVLRVIVLVMMDEVDFREKMAGLLLGTALGDALGFIAEGLDCAGIRSRFGKIDRFHVIGNHGYVTDDTEQSGLVAYCLIKHDSDVEECSSCFRRALLLWYLCFPFGIGRATIQACSRIAIGIKNSGVPSAGNGAAMRAAIIGGYFYDRPDARKQFVGALSAITHTDPRALEGAHFVSEIAAACTNRSQEDLISMFQRALDVVRDESLRVSLMKAAEMAKKGVDIDVASSILVKKPYAFILHSLPFATFCFLRNGDGDVVSCLADTVSGGGDTDTNSAIVGAWLGAMKGQNELSTSLMNCIDDGPFGPSHLQRLAEALTAVKFGRECRPPEYSLVHSFARNIFLLPVIIIHALFRLLPRS